MNSKDESGIIVLNKLNKTYYQGETPIYALRDIDLVIKQGEFLAVMGPSGSGKSTLMNVLGLLDRQDSGSYRLGGTEVAGMTDDELSQFRSCSIGFVFQNFNLLSRATALRNVILPLSYQRTPINERIDRAKAALESVGLGGRIDHYPNQLSGGECQRVAIARALVGGPSVLLADEPTGNLDSKIGAEIMEILQKLSENGMTIVMVTHDPIVAQRADRIITMLDGRIQKTETLREK